MVAVTARDPASPGYRRFIRGTAVRDMRTGQVAKVAKDNKRGEATIHITYVDADTGQTVFDQWPIEHVWTIARKIA